MGQDEVINFLKGCDKPVTRKQIADGMNFDPIKISKILVKLLKWHEVDFIEHPTEEAAKMVDYPLYRRTRFFFLVREVLTYSHR